MNEKDKHTAAVIEKALQKRPPAPPPEDVHIYFRYEKKFLDTYAATFDFKLALKESGMKAHEVRKNKYLMKELGILQQQLQKAHRIKAASGKHIELMEKFEKHYDELKKDEKDKEAVTMAGNLSRMSDSAMRASGEFSHEKDDGHAGVQLNVQINLGHDYAEAPIDVEATKEDEG